MTLDLNAIRSALADALADIPDARVFEQVPSTVPVGAHDVIVLRPGADYVTYQVGAARTSRCEVRFLVTALAPPADQRGAQVRLDQLVSSGTTDGRSVRDALEASRSLGGVSCDVTVEAARFVVLEVGGVDYPSIEWDVLVLARSAA